MEVQQEPPVPSERATETLHAGRSLTLAYAALQGLLAILASLAASGILFVFVIVGMVGFISDLNGVYTLPPAEQMEVFRTAIRDTGELWKLYGLTAGTIAVIAGVLLLVGILRHHLRRRAKRAKRLDHPAVTDPLPEPLRGREVWSTPGENTAVERSAIVLSPQAVKRALAGRGYRFILWHEWFHAATGDNSWRVAGTLFGRLAALVGAAIATAVAILLTPIFWAPEWLRPLLVLGIGVVVFQAMYRWNGAAAAAFGQIKEFSADTFAHDGSGETADLCYAGEKPAPPTGYLVRASDPNPQERLSFIERRATDRIFVLVSSLLFNWIVLRLVCWVSVGPLGLMGMSMVLAVDALMVAAFVLPLRWAAASGARPRTLLGWALVGMPALLAFGGVAPLIAYWVMEVGPWLGSDPAYNGWIVGLAYPWMPAALILVTGWILARRWTVEGARSMTGGDAEPAARSAAGRVALTEGMIRGIHAVGRMQSWVVLLVAGLIGSYAILVTFVFGHGGSAFDVATIVTLAIAAFAATNNLAQMRRPIEKRRAWPLLLEGGSLFLGILFGMYLLWYIIPLVSEEFRGRLDTEALQLRLNDWLTSLDLSPMVADPEPVLVALLIGLAPYPFRLWSLRWKARSDP
ncbi:hypothetical protein HL658_25330 [Azospirillum sp. RWY-5-1]|nr:hypothetical protein [Azospirillum oleiclasticum]NYZ15876.1 hypothetical protein [Azospirillum oleiclasticum]